MNLSLHLQRCLSNRERTVGNVINKIEITVEASKCFYFGKDSNLLNKSNGNNSRSTTHRLNNSDLGLNEFDYLIKT